ncbi:MAG TPA: ester cyclase [Sphingobium sp.]
MTHPGLEERYRKYIDAVNSGRLPEAAEFYHDQIQCNDKIFSRADFTNKILGFFSILMPDGQIEISNIVVDGDHLAARLLGTGTLAREWKGLKPGGDPVTFAEHAFYQLRDGRVAAVWSVVDLVG